MSHSLQSTAGKQNNEIKHLEKKRFNRRVSPEVVHEVFELVCAFGQRDDDVDWDAGCVHPLVFHLHQRPKGAEEDQASEFITGLPSEGQLVQRPFVLLCTGDT